MKLYFASGTVFAILIGIAFVLVSYLAAIGVNRIRRSNHYQKTRRPRLGNLLFTLFALLYILHTLLIPTDSLHQYDACTDQYGNCYVFDYTDSSHRRSGDPSESAARIMKFDYSGKLQWNRLYSGGEFLPLSFFAIAGPKAGIYLCTLPPVGSPNNNVHLIRLDPEVQILWERVIETNAFDTRFFQDHLRVMGTRADQRLYQDYDIETGQLLSSTALSHEILNPKRYTKLDLHIDSGGDFIVWAYYDRYSVIAKLSAADQQSQSPDDQPSQPLWEYRIDKVDSAENVEIIRTSTALDQQDCLYSAGYYSIEAYLEKYSPEGTLLWTKELTPGQRGDTNRITDIRFIQSDSIDSAGSAYVVMEHYKAYQPEQKKYSLIKIAGDGSVVWSQLVETPFEFDTDGAGNAYLFSLSPGRGPVSIVKYGPDGRQLWKAHSLRPDWILWIFKLTGIALFVWQLLRAKRPNRTADEVEEVLP